MQIRGPGRFPHTTQGIAERCVLQYKSLDGERQAAMDQLGIFTRLENARRILLAGAGGGYDIFCGLPLYFALNAMGKQVFLGNLTFSFTENVEGNRPSDAVLEVTSDSVSANPYFPEKYLCEWFAERGEQVSVYCFDRTGYLPLAEAYRTIVKGIDIDSLVLIDGGTDSLMRGDEFGLGTPHEDVLSLAVGNDLELERKLLVCSAFGVDHFHRVCHANFLEAVAALCRAGAYLGAFSLLPSMDAVGLYRQAAKFVFDKMAGMESIVNSSLIAAIEGSYGDVHSTDRTRGSRLWINPLMAMYWVFELDPVANRNLYLDRLRATRHILEVDDIIDKFRAELPSIREWEPIPL